MKHSWQNHIVFKGHSRIIWYTYTLWKDPSPLNGLINISIGRIDAKAEAPILWPPDAKSRLIGKDPDAGKDWRQEEKGVTEDEMVGWHHWLNGHEFKQTPRDGEGQRSLVCCNPWGCKELDTTEWLNNRHCTYVPFPGLLYSSIYFLANWIN